MRPLLIIAVCIGSLAAGALLAAICSSHMVELLRVATDSGSIYTASATTPAAAATPESAQNPAQWTPPAILPSQPNWTWQTKDGKTYENVVITAISSTEVAITHSLGAARIPLDDLPAEVQKALNYAPSAAATPQSNPSAVAAMLDGKLIDVTGQPIATPDNSIKYYAIYFASSKDPQCQSFTPLLVDWYRKFKPYHHNFELVFVSEDLNSMDMFNFMQATQMPWPAVRYEQLPRSAGTFRGPGIEQFANTGIPDLVLVDSSGKVLADSFKGDTFVGPQSVLDYAGNNLSMN